MSKLCECGCGGIAPIAVKTSTAQGYTKGQPHRFIQGHQFLVRTGVAHHNWKGEKVGYHALHAWVGRQKQKTGFCSACRQKRRTQWANIDHRYQRVLDDWIELCVSCHRLHDIEQNGLKPTPAQLEALKAGRRYWPRKRTPIFFPVS